MPDTGIKQVNASPYFSIVPKRPVDCVYTVSLETYWHHEKNGILRDGQKIRIRKSYDSSSSMDIGYTILLDFLGRGDVARFHIRSLITEIRHGTVLSGHDIVVLLANHERLIGTMPIRRGSVQPGRYGVYESVPYEGVYMNCPKCGAISKLDGYLFYIRGKNAACSPCFMCPRTACQFHFWPILLNWSGPRRDFPSDE